MDDIVRTKQITLPDGETVSTPVILDEEWFTHNKTGFLDPNLLAPNQRQPRKYMDPVSLAELKENIRQIGVRESILITPMKYAPWANVAPKHRDRPYFIVSGHRRTSSACEAGITAVPVRVKVYDSEESFLDDSSVLNKHRDNLSELEEGYELRDRIERGEKITHLVISEGRSFAHLKKRIALTYLAPDLQELISPRLTTRQRLAIGMMSALGDLDTPSTAKLEEKAETFNIPTTELGANGVVPGELTDLSDEELLFCLQRLYLKYVQKMRWNGSQSEKFIRTGEVPQKNPGSGRHHGLVETTKKETVREQMVKWCKGVRNKSFMEMSPKELRTAFQYAVREDLEQMVEMLQATSDDINGMAKLLTKLAKEKPVTRKEVLELSKRSEQEAY